MRLMAAVAGPNVATAPAMIMRGGAIWADILARAVEWKPIGSKLLCGWLQTPILDLSCFSVRDLRAGASARHAMKPNRKEIAKGIFLYTERCVRRRSRVARRGVASQTAAPRNWRRSRQRCRAAKMTR